ncbi:MAG: hypothetical protein AB7O45_10585 [Alphaproteobacteria bacterium]
MLTVVCWKWRQPGYRQVYTAEHVNVLGRMIERHLEIEHELVCVTDDPAGIDGHIRIVPLWAEHGDVANPSSPEGPSCYRRLRMFEPGAAAWLGERILSIDLDMVITGPLAPLVDRAEDFVAMGDTARSTAYNGSLILLRAGSRPQVWEQFDAAASPAATRAARMVGSDQAWISHVLGPGEATWSKADGVYSFRNDLSRSRGPLPEGALVVNFHGHWKPWHGAVQADHRWVLDHWR